MNTLTHALLPVILADVVMRGRKGHGGKGLVVIGVAGALPDLLNPHLSLEARMQSWSHGLPFFAVFALCVLLTAGLSKGRFSLRLGLSACAAYFLHLVCDGISGGINWLHPVAEYTWGRYWVHPLYWIPLDIVCILISYSLFRFLPLWQRRGRCGSERP